MASDVTAVLNQCRSELGYTEQPPGSNRTKFAAEAGHANGYAWCATFVVAMFRRCQITLPSESAYTPTMSDGFKKAGKWRSSNPQPGDVVFFRWPNLGRIAHVGVVEYVRGDTVYTIEGNTDQAGGRTGGKVMRQARTRYIAGYGIPDYVTVGPPPLEEDDMAQMIPNYKPDGALHYFYVPDGGDLYHAWWPRSGTLGRHAEDLGRRVDIEPGSFDGQPSVTVDADNTIHVVCDRKGSTAPSHVFYVPGKGWAAD